MNKIYTLILIALLGMACSDWLDVRPRTEMKEEDMYKVETGFKNVLTGIYIRLASESLYGKNMTMYFPELLAQHWQFSNNYPYRESYIQKFDYEKSGVEDLIATMWLQYYKTIANLNNLLQEIENKKEIFTHGNYELIKGEALGLRAFLHLDILRLWGPIPSKVSDNELVIPYLTEMTKDPNKSVSLPYHEVLEKILADLEHAEKLLAEDPIIICRNRVLNMPNANWAKEPVLPEDEFHYYRQNRFNYYAVKATKARYYSWIGEKAKAADCAREIIGALNPEDGKTKFTLANQVAEGMIDGEEGDRIRSCEHVFALHNPYLEEVVKPLFMEFRGFYQPVNYVKTAFETTLHTGDIRYANNRYWVEKAYDGTNYNLFKKYWVTDATSTQLVPLIRLSEMYFIVMEGSTLAEANEKFTTFRISRNMDSSVDQSLEKEIDVTERLEKEYRKEFYGEGQMFYWYKRHAVVQYTWPKKMTMNLDKYQIPKPDQQIVFE